jgi:hypothetical protein
VRGEFRDEDADLSVDEGLVVVGLGGDFDWLLGLRCEEGCQTENEGEAGHCRDCSIGAGARNDRAFATRAGRSGFLTSFGMTRSTPRRAALDGTAEGGCPHMIKFRSSGQKCPAQAEHWG